MDEPMVFSMVSMYVGTIMFVEDSEGLPGG